ncbi:MAG: hypothetical protein ACD_62C00215G0002 [uncultured bacterium]|nr:MAG: hypothetical protein ACD_62C00215G0002 [uncultured bacterium]HLD44478.1 hypothetical protein [bacterium]
MVDRLEIKYSNQTYRVDASRDALEEERKESQDEEGDGQPNDDKFGSLRDGQDLQRLFEKNQLWNRNIQIKVEDIDKIKVLGLNLKTEPSLLKIRIFLYDGAVIPTAIVSVSRSLAFQIRGLKNAAFVDVNMLTKGTVLSVTVPKDENQIDEEITKITGVPREKTLSRTFKMLISKRNWLQKFGLQDPVSKKINNEIIWVYITTIALMTLLSFGVLYLLT